MKDIDLSSYALEDLLSFDDIFLDYFNNFLRNPAFPQPLQFNRYLGLFEEIYNLDNLVEFVDRLPKSTIGLNHLATDGGTTFSSNEGTENQKVFDWVRKERLPLFFRTNLFREFKLCKLLVRPLDEDRKDSATSSQLIGGYSRQSPPSTNTLSTEDDDGRITSEDKTDYIEDSNGLYMSPTTYYQQLEKLNKYLFQRPGSRAFSVPAYFPFFTNTELKAMNTKKFLKKKSPKFSEYPKTPKNAKNSDLKRLVNFEDLTKINELDQNKNVEIDDNSLSVSTKLTSTKNKVTDTFVVDGEYSNNNDEDDDDDDENDYVDDENEDFGNENYNDEDDDDDDDDNDDEEIYGVTDETLKNNVNEFSYDEDLGLTDKVHASINQYKQKFLGSVRGLNDFKDFLKSTSNGEKFLKFWLDCEFFRDSMQDYDQIEHMATRNRLFRDINEKFVFPFSDKMHRKIRENYLSTFSLNHNVFSRIQYDILRRLRSYWVPRYILNRLRTSGKDYGLYPLPPLTPDYSRQSTYNTILSPPKFPMHSVIKKRFSNISELSDDYKRSMIEKIKQALYVDKEAGGPFLRFISLRYSKLLALLLFRYDVNDFRDGFHNQIDKKSRLQHAWSIYNNYLSAASRFHIGSADEYNEVIRKNLQSLSNGNGDIDQNLFEQVTESLLPKLLEPWVEFLKEDILRYTEAKLAILDLNLNNEDAIIPQENIEPIIEIDGETIHINRPWVRKYFNGNVSDEKTDKVKIKEPMSEEKKAEIARKRKIMEIERRKALKAAKIRLKRQQLSAKARLGVLQEEHLSQSQLDRIHSRYPSSFLSDKSIFFDKMMISNKSMVQLMRKFLAETSQKELLNKFNCFLEARQYMDLHDAHKKMVTSFSLQKIYLDPNSKRNVLPLNERLQAKLSVNEQRGNVRPRTPFMNAITREFRPALEEQFQKFCEIKSKEYALKSPEEFANLTQSELLLILGDSYNAKDFYLDEEKGDGKLMPSKDDRNEFIKLLGEWSIGKIDLKFYSFYAHLTENGKKDGLPFLEKDLLFCIDSIRLKEISGDDVVKQKCQLILEFYLDSVIPPTVQIDINHEAHQKLIRAIARILQNTHALADFIPFDDVRSQLTKDLLPYWAGFKNTYKPTGKRPLTKLEKILKERLDEFFNVKNPSPNDFKLPQLNPKRKEISSQHNNGSIQIIFSLTTGIKYRDDKTNQTLGDESPTNIIVSNQITN